MNRAAIVFPNQLFHHHPLLSEGFNVFLIEESLFFTQYAFHKVKIAFHRASMKAFAETYSSFSNIQHISYDDERSDVRLLISYLNDVGYKEIHLIYPDDNWIENRVKKQALKHNIQIIWHESPAFINTRAEIEGQFRKDSKKFFQTTFYKNERKKQKLLVTEHNEPWGGKWSFDNENRNPFPKNRDLPDCQTIQPSKLWLNAAEFAQLKFKDNPGITDCFVYPYTRDMALEWLDDFLKNRFSNFGEYEDAIVKDATIMHHSLLSPLLNIGLLTPKEVINEALRVAAAKDIPLNSVEGFIRQIIGWREFIRGVYHAKGSYERTRNFWQFNKKMPKVFYTANTGILPVDHTIQKVLKTGYCHHIERLMILGNFMLLCEIHPDEVYIWFMELFIDAYDWVMVPNVFGMSQFADGGLMSSKPYISGSNYILKMSDYKKGEWQEIWDGLFWRFIHKHSDFFLSNPRMSMMVKSWERMPELKRESHLYKAEKFLKQLHTP